jgi:beta-mannanase
MGGTEERARRDGAVVITRRAVLPSLAAVATVLTIDPTAAQETAEEQTPQRRADAARRRAASLRADQWPVIPGALVRVTGSGFAPNRRGAIVWEPPAGDPVRLATARSDGRGRLAAEVRIPNDATAGGQIVARIAGKSAASPVEVQVPEPGGVALGAFERSKGQEAPWSAAALARLEDALGRNPEIVMWFQGWGAGGGGADFQLELLKRVTDRGAIPLVTWEPWTPGAGRDQPAYRLAQIPLGTYDTYIQRWATEFKKWGKPALVRFAHEMNGRWYPWAAGVNGNSSDDYRNAWRHVRNVFIAEGATNVGWVWCPNVGFDGSTPLDSLYPGDAHVDWVGVDGYNWGTRAAQGQGWQTFLEVFDDTLATLRTLAPGKPLMIAETGCSPDGGNKAAWLRRALYSELPLQFPEVRALVWFNANKEEQWRFDTDPSSLRAFRAAADNPYYADQVESVVATRRAEGSRREIEGGRRERDDRTRDRRRRRDEPDRRRRNRKND